MKKESILGLFYTISAFTIWGVLPLFWNLLKKINSAEILAHRVLWAFLFFLIINLIKGNKKKVKNTFKEKDKIKLIAFSSFLLGSNWFLYVWAVTHGKVIEASMGYYINPIFSIFLGMLFLKEKLTRLQVIALISAIIGVLIIIFGYGKFPWVAILLMLLFGLYGLAKKLSKTDSLISLNIETLLMLPFILFIILKIRIKEMQLLPQNSLYYLLLLIIGGILTAIPIYFFSQGAKLVKLSYIGFFQYISPSLNLIIGIFILKETFTRIHLISFCFIWFALFLFIISNFNIRKKPLKESVFVE